jgi:hypothetical protein
MIDVPRELARIKRGDFDAVFGHGGCFVFARRLRQRFAYATRGFSFGEDEQLAHVWGRREAMCVDIRGIHAESIVIALACAAGGTPSKPRDVSPDELDRIIAGKEYPSSFLATLTELADRIIDTHQRFRGVRPPDAGRCAELVSFLNEIPANKASLQTPASGTPAAASTAEATEAGGAPVAPPPGAANH